MDVETGKAKRVVRVPGDTEQARLSPDGRRVAVCGGGQLQVLNLADGETVLTQDTWPESPEHTGWSKDGEVWSLDRTSVLHVLDPKTGAVTQQTLGTPATEGPAYVLNPNSDGSMWAEQRPDGVTVYGRDGQEVLKRKLRKAPINVWFWGDKLVIDTQSKSGLWVRDLKSGEHYLLGTEIPVDALASPSGRYVFWRSNRTLRRLDMQKAERVFFVNAFQGKAPTSGTLVLGPEGRFALSWGDHELRILDNKGDLLRAWSAHRGPFQAGYLAEDVLATASVLGTVAVVGLRRGAQARSRFWLEPHQMALSPQGTLVSQGRRTLTMMDPREEKPLWEQTSEKLQHLRFSADGGAVMASSTASGARLRLASGLGSKAVTAPS